MSFTKKTIALSCIGVLLSASAAFAQVSGAEVPGAAKAKAGMTRGTSMTKHHTMRGGAMHHRSMMRSSKGKMPGHKTF